MNYNEWISLITAIGSILTPFVVLALTAFGWKIKKSIEKNFNVEEKLREDRIAIYNILLEPFVIVFTTDEAWKSDPKNREIDKDAHFQSTILSLDYKRAAFKLTLIADDNVVLAFNKLMQFFYHSDDVSDQGEKLRINLENLGHFLLEIRKSQGNDKTRLKDVDMLEWFITDVRKVLRPMSKKSLQK